MGKKQQATMVLYHTWGDKCGLIPRYAAMFSVGSFFHIDLVAHDWLKLDDLGGKSVFSKSGPFIFL